MSVFFLIRHAHADWVPDESRPLSDQGYRGATRVADLLSPMPIRVIYTSPARRARQTVEPLAARLGLPIHTVPDLRERELGSVADGDFLEAVEATWSDPSFAHPGGESHAAAQRRGVAVLRRLQELHRGEHIVLSTHGTLLALILQYYDRSVGFALWRSLTMPDIHALSVGANGEGTIQRLWCEGHACGCSGAACTLEAAAEELRQAAGIESCFEGRESGDERSEPTWAQCPAQDDRVRR